MSSLTRRGLLLTGALTGLAGGLAACSSSDPLAPSSQGSGSSPSVGGKGGSLTVGSANFAESQILAEIYAQALEKAGMTVNRRMQIGARDVYISALKDGSIDLVPEYTGNLLQFFDPKAKASDPDQVVSQLRSALPQGLAVAEPSKAQDSDSWCVTKEFSQRHDLTSLAQLASVPGTLRIGGNPELKERPYGPQGLTKVYGVPADKMSFTALSDSSGPLTVKALMSGTVDLVDLYTTTPAISENQLVVLDDPRHLIVAQNVIPLMSKRVAGPRVDDVLNPVSKTLTTADLTAMNARSQGREKASAETIAHDWLASKHLV